MKALLALALAVQPGIVLATGSSLDEDLAAVRSLLDRQRWSEAKRELLGVLESHRDTPELPRHLPEIEDHLTRASFFLAHPRIAPEDAVAGRLESYRSNGALTVTYDLGARGDLPEEDFIHVGGVWTFQPAVEGSLGVELRGSFSAGDQVDLLLVNGDGRGLDVAVTRDQVAVFELAENDSRLLGQVDQGAGAQGRPVRVLLEARRVAVEAGGRRLVDLRADVPLPGRMGISGTEGLGQIRIEGTFSPSWVEGKVDQATELARNQFEEGFRVEDELPGWVAEAKRAARSGARPLDSPAGLASVEALGVTEAALAAAEAFCDATPDSPAARLLRNELLLGLRGVHVAIADGAEIVAAFPQHSDAHRALAELHLVLGDRARAEEVLAGALEHAAWSDGIDEIARVLMRARLGPAWSRTFEARSKHYVVRSDISRQLCFEAGQVLDTAYQKYHRQLGRLPARTPGQAEVYVFSGQLGYLRYGTGIGGLPVHTAGAYSPALGQVLAWNLWDRDSLMATLRHEALHQYLDARIPGAPSWLHEGLAEYFEPSELVRGSWTDGVVVTEHVELLRRGSRPTLEELVALTPEEFYGRASTHYALAWAFVHFLHHGPQSARRLWQSTFDALVDGESAAAAQARVFGGAGWADLQRDFERHLETL